MSFLSMAQKKNCSAQMYERILAEKHQIPRTSTLGRWMVGLNRRLR
jgi:hypothetical protein